MRKRIAVLILTIALLLGICATALEIRCQQLNTPPQAPVYPGSTLTHQAAFGIGEASPIVDYDYTAPDPPEKIVAFYTEKGSCGEGARGTGAEGCSGSAVPFGKYRVGINLESYASQGVTSYFIELYWEGCGPGLVVNP